MTVINEWKSPDGSIVVSLCVDARLTTFELKKIVKGKLTLKINGPVSAAIEEFDNVVVRAWRHGLSAS